MKYHRALAHPDWIPVECVEPVLRKFIEDHDRDLAWESHSTLGKFNDASRLTSGSHLDAGDAVTPFYGRNWLVQEAGVSPKLLHRILNHTGVHKNRAGKLVPNCRWVPYWTLDKLLTAMGLPHLLHVAVEDGGFAF